MGPRHDEPRKESEQSREEPKRRFQIVKLEERIAPRTSYYKHHGNGWYKNHGH